MSFFYVFKNVYPYFIRINQIIYLSFYATCVKSWKKIKVDSEQIPWIENFEFKLYFLLVGNF